MDLQEIASALKKAILKADKILLTGPIYPDGDSIGSSLALAIGIEQFTESKVDVIGKASFRYDWLPHAHRLISDDQCGEKYDLAIVLDGDRHRLHPRVEKAFTEAKCKAIIDHHDSVSTDGYDICAIDKAAASACGITYKILNEWGIPLKRDVAALIYTGLIFDTGGFKHPNTTPETHNLASLLLSTGFDHSQISAKILMERKQSGVRLLAHALSGIQYLDSGKVAFSSVNYKDLIRMNCGQGDYEGIVEAMLFIEGVDISCLCIERDVGMIKISLRSRCEVDVCALAQRISKDGGGHKRAAGAVIKTDMKTLSEKIISDLNEISENRTA